MRIIDFSVIFLKIDMKKSSTLLLYGIEYQNSIRIYAVYYLLTSMKICWVNLCQLKDFHYFPVKKDYMVIIVQVKLTEFQLLDVG